MLSPFRNSTELQELLRAKVLPGKCIQTRYIHCIKLSALRKPELGQAQCAAVWEDHGPISAETHFCLVTGAVG